MNTLHSWLLGVMAFLLFLHQEIGNFFCRFNISVFIGDHDMTSLTELNAGIPYNARNF